MPRWAIVGCVVPIAGATIVALGGVAAVLISFWLDSSDPDPTAVPPEEPGALIQEQDPVPVLGLMPTDYEVTDGLRDDASVYIDDSAFMFSEVPEAIIGATYIRTENGDKFVEGEEFISFSSPQPVTVYVAHDDRYTTKPSWLDDFVRTGLDVVIDPVGGLDATASLFRKEFRANTTIVLGGNHTAEGGNNVMYSVIIVGR